MPSEKSESGKGITSVIHALLSFIPNELREMVGFFTGLVLMFAVPAAVIISVMILYHTMQKAKITEVACWQIQAVENRLFKLNSCTGELTEVKDLPAPKADDKKGQKK